MTIKRKVSGGTPEQEKQWVKINRRKPLHICWASSIWTMKSKFTFFLRKTLFLSQYLSSKGHSFFYLIMRDFITRNVNRESTWFSKGSFWFCWCRNFSSRLYLSEVAPLSSSPVGFLSSQSYPKSLAWLSWATSALALESFELSLQAFSSTFT